MILAIRLKGLFWAGQNVWDWTLDLAFGGFTIWLSKSSGRKGSWPKGLDFGLGLWRLHTMPDRRLKFLFFISTYFVELSTKFDHSIPRPLDLNNHSVKRPLNQASMYRWLVLKN